MNDRLDRWHEFRKHIALRTKLMFQYLLSTRAYYGKVLFEHDKQKLEIRVQTDDQAATQGLNKDAKSLSGGEKSFSTICLLLALWQAIGCPIRCLGTCSAFFCSSITLLPRRHEPPKCEIYFPLGACICSISELSYFVCGHAEKPIRDVRSVLRHFSRRIHNSIALPHLNHVYLSGILVTPTSLSPCYS